MLAKSIESMSPFPGWRSARSLALRPLRYFTHSPWDVGLTQSPTPARPRAPSCFLIHCRRGSCESLLVLPTLSPPWKPPRSSVPLSSTCLQSFADAASLSSARHHSSPPSLHSQWLALGPSHFLPLRPHGGHLTRPLPQFSLCPSLHYNCVKWKYEQLNSIQKLSSVHSPSPGEPTEPFRAGPCLLFQLCPPPLAKASSFSNHTNTWSSQHASSFMLLSFTDAQSSARTSCLGSFPRPRSAGLAVLPRQCSTPLAPGSSHPLSSTLGGSWIAPQNNLYQGTLYPIVLWQSGVCVRYLRVPVCGKRCDLEQKP